MDPVENILYRLALSMADNVGSVRAKQLIAYCGGAKAVFEENSKALSKIPGISGVIIKSLKKKEIFVKAEKEISFISNKNIRVLYFLEDDYPDRLKPYEDAPIILFYKGNRDLNKYRHVSVVGTRTPTERGKWSCDKLIEGFKDLNIMTISGLAYGIDAQAHKASLQNGIPSIGVVAHGLDRIYPNVHTKLAQEMLENGGLLTEFPSNTNPDRDRFPARNRIIAGMSDALIVIESKKSGGSMITANFANDYSKDVFAVPGRISDEYSQGCNKLIKEHKAFLLDSSEELIKMMRWEARTEKQVQRSLFLDLKTEEKEIVELIKIGIDQIDAISESTSMSLSELSALLLELEFKGVVKTLPGKKYLLLE